MEVEAPPAAALVVPTAIALPLMAVPVAAVMLPMWQASKVELVMPPPMMAAVTVMDVKKATPEAALVVPTAMALPLEAVPVVAVMVSGEVAR